MADTNKNQYTAAPEKKRDVTAWVVFASPEMFTLTLSKDQNYFAQGDALLIADR